MQSLIAVGTPKGFHLQITDSAGGQYLLSSKKGGARLFKTLNSVARYVRNILKAVHLEVDLTDWEG